MKYPSDSVPFGLIRRYEDSKALSATGMCQARPADIDIVALHRWERILAEKAFAEALRAKDRHAEHDRDAIVRDILTPGYTRYALSSGPAQVNELVRRMEIAAAEQARRHIRRTGGPTGPMP